MEPISTRSYVCPYMALTAAPESCGMHQSTAADPLLADPTGRGTTRPLHCVAGVGRLVLRRIEVLACLIAACALLIPMTDTSSDGSPVQNPAHSVAVALILLSAYATYRRVRAYVLAEPDRDRVVALQARLQGVSLAANTFRHHVRNRLAVTVGYSELLADDPRLPTEIREQAHKILTSARAAAETMYKLEARLGDAKLDTRLAGPPMLDLGDVEAAARRDPTID